MSTEIKDMMSSLVAVFQRASPEASQPRRNPPAPISEVLQPPLKLSITAEHVGANYRHLVANPSDYIIVYAWTNHQEMAIAYNTPNDTTGRIPTDLLSKEEL